VVDRTRVHEQQDHINLGRTDLQTKAAAIQVIESRSTPTTFVAATDDAFARAAADNKPGFVHLEDGNCFSLVQQALWNRLIAHIHYRLEDIGGFLSFLRRLGKFLCVF